MVRRKILTIVFTLKLIKNKFFYLIRKHFIRDYFCKVGSFRRLF